jgi:glycosyltransferase involved in cell wall biosynthesis
MGRNIQMTNEKSRIVWISDMDLVGSGYLNITVPLCEGLTKRGHDVKVLGLNYRGQEHNYPFSIIPASGLQETVAMFQNIYNMWQFHVLIIALDIYTQNPFIQVLQNRKPFGHIGIMAVEAPPLCMTWAMILNQMEKPFIISEFGTEAAKKSGVFEAEHLQIGIDTKAWRPSTSEEKKESRSALYGIEDDTFIVLTVADNQERKNLAAGMEIFKEFSKDKKATYVLITRENSIVGWRLRDYAQEIGILNNFMIFERGMPFSELWMHYASADCFLLPSKAEGLGMPLLEAMSMKIPCIATKCTGMKELLSDGRGYLVEEEYIHRDCFGNGTRWWINKDKAKIALDNVYSGNAIDTQLGRDFVEKRDWESSVLRLENAILKIRSDVESARERAREKNEGNHA